MSTVALPSSRRLSLAWLGMLPFLLFGLVFLLYPASTILARSFQDKDGAFTLANLTAVFEPALLDAYGSSIQLSIATAVAGALLGTLLAWAVTLGGLPNAVRSAVVTFCSVAANFGGIPLAFAFITLLGRTGALTKLLRDSLDIDLYAMGFSIYSLPGLMLAYLYFQFPLMVLIMLPAFDGLKREWREAAASLGGDTVAYWRHVGIPVLLPSFLGATVLLFGNAFGAYATAEALTGSRVELITRVISRQIRGDVLYNPGLSYALALGMVVVLSIAIVLYALLQRRAARWMR